MKGESIFAFLIKLKDIAYKALKILPVVSDNIINGGIIDIPIQMNHSIPKADHLSEGRHKIIRQYVVFIEDFKSIVAALGWAVSFIGHNVMSQVQTTFN